MAKLIKLTETQLNKLFNILKEEEMKIDSTNYLIKKTNLGKFRLFVSDPKYSIPMDAKEIFGDNPLWKNYETQEEAEQAINYIKKIPSMKK